MQVGKNLNMQYKNNIFNVQPRQNICYINPANQVVIVHKTKLSHSHVHFDKQTCIMNTTSNVD